MSLQSLANGQYLRRTTGWANSQPVTIALWFRINDTSAYRTVWDHGDSSDYAPQLFYDDAANAISIVVNGGGAFELLVLDPSPTAGVWYWAAVVLDGAAPVVAYWAKDGAPALSGGSSTGNFLGFTGPDLTFCDEMAADQTIDGQVAGIKIWTAALSPSEVLAEYGSYGPVRTANLYSVPYSGGATGAGVDSSGNGNDFAAVGALSTSPLEPPVAPPGPPSASGTGGRMGAGARAGTGFRLAVGIS